MSEKTAVIIPARYGSTRFPGKILASLGGKPVLQWVYENALRSGVDRVVIATDDEKVMAAAAAFGAESVMTSSEHCSGTDRVHEAAGSLDADIIVNVQGDEPEIDPASIEKVAALLTDNPDAVMATLVTRFKDKAQLEDPNVVKVVLGVGGEAIYFSRAPIPYNRDSHSAQASLAYRHLGIYAYRKDFLLEITKKEQTPLEKCESLEQLRVIENGHKILTAVVEHHCEGIDTEQQYKAFVERYKGNLK